jgi:hypothetical protein
MVTIELLPPPYLKPAQDLNDDHVFYANDMMIISGIRARLADPVDGNTNPDYSINHKEKAYDNDK